MSKQDQAVTAGHRIAIKHAKFPDGRLVYGPLRAETLGRSIDAAIKRAKSSAVRKERERCLDAVGIEAVAAMTEKRFVNPGRIIDAIRKGKA